MTESVTTSTEPSQPIYISQEVREMIEQRDYFQSRMVEIMGLSLIPLPQPIDWRVIFRDGGARD